MLSAGPRLRRESTRRRRRERGKNSGSPGTIGCKRCQQGRPGGFFRFRSSSCSVCVHMGKGLKFKNFPFSLRPLSYRISTKIPRRSVDRPRRSKQSNLPLPILLLGWLFDVVSLLRSADEISPLLSQKSKDAAAAEDRHQKTLLFSKPPVRSTFQDSSERGARGDFCSPPPFER